MKLYPIIVTFVFLLSCQANADDLKKANDPSFDGKYVKATSSKYCHSPDSTYRYAINVLPDESNVYKNEQDCLDDGGKLPPSVQKARIAQDPEALDQALYDEQENEGTENLYGINWGLGLAFASFGQEAIQEVVIDNSKVRVEESSHNKAIAMLESHYFWRHHQLSNSTIGHGFFVTVGIASDDGIDPLSTYGVGYMLGFRRSITGESFNIGLGAIIDTKYQQLRADVYNGSSTTETDPSKLLKTEDELGFLLMFSATF